MKHNTERIKNNRRDFNKDTANGFPERLNYLIKFNKFSKKEFAEKIGATPTFVSNMLHQGSKPSWTFLQAISESFNVNLNWLVLGEGEPFKLQKADEQMRRQNNAKHTKIRLDEKLAKSVAARVTLKSLLHQNQDNQEIKSLTEKIFIDDNLDIEVDVESVNLPTENLQKNLFAKELQWFLEAYNKAVDMPEEEQLSIVSSCLLKPMLRNKKIPSTPQSDSISKLWD